MDRPYWNRKAEEEAYWAACFGGRDQWVAAAQGNEEPFLREGRWTLRVYNPGTGESGYYDFGTDIVTTDKEAADAA